MQASEKTTAKHLWNFGLVSFFFFNLMGRLASQLALAASRTGAAGHPPMVAFLGVFAHLVRMKSVKK